MPRTVLKDCFGCAALSAAPRVAPATAAFLTIALIAIDVSKAQATVVDTGQAQCCSSIQPEKPPATYYGATMFRESDSRSQWKPHLATPADPPASIEQLLEDIDQLEASGGAMTTELAHSLEGLAAAYLAENRDAEAIKTLRRGIHLARVHNGLHAPEQIEMVEQLILAYVRRGDFAAADSQQSYLYRIKSWQREHGSAEMLEATLRYADWHRGAYLADMDQQRYPRLVSLHDLYADGIKELQETHGVYSEELLPYLQGRIELSYLISVYPGEQEASFRGGVHMPGDFSGTSEAEVKFWRLRDPNYNFRYGLKALERRSEILSKREPVNAVEHANSLIAIGDWYQWHRRYAKAIKIYRQAWVLMDGKDGGENWQRQRLWSPLELPKDTVFNPGVVPLDTPNTAEISVKFDVSRHGEAKEIEFLTPRSEDNQIAITRAYHYLKNVRFRPRVDAGEVVHTSGVERTYKIRY